MRFIFKYMVAAVSLCPMLPALAASPIEIETPQGVMVLTPMADNAIRVRVTAAPTHAVDELIYVDAAPDVETYVDREDGYVAVRLKDITAYYDVAQDMLTFTDASGLEVFAEVPAGRVLTPSEVQGEPTYIASQTFVSQPDERLYGTGQFQDGYLNVRGLSRRLTQVNTQISVPMVVSDKGYGLLWNNYGLTDYNPPTHTVLLSPSGSEGEAVTVDVTTDHGNAREIRRNNTFVADIDLPENGEYAILMDVGQSMARKHKVIIDGEVWTDVNNVWLPPTTSFIAKLSAGTHHVEVEGVDGDCPSVSWRKVDDTTTWSSPVAQGIDYTVMTGDPDRVIATYRQLTGPAPMMPIWALGYIHCRERYHDQAELLENARQFRERDIPIDMIVQDWQWWGKHGWNAMRFDEDHYPDPKQMVDSLHAQNTRLMLSVWSKIDRNSQLGHETAELGHYIPGTEWIDFFSPAAADFYWSNFSDRLLKPYGIDAWWQDATEPENDDLRGRRIASGTLPGEVYRNAYPLMVNRTVYEGLRRDDPERRTMILTRCGFPGIQRYGAATWSGDVGNDWETLRRQLAGGLGIIAAGLPWWTYDAGGFFRPGDQYTDPAYQERLIRWIQISTFLPLMRVHGYMSDTEPWRYGEQVDSIARQYIQLRYDLMPYIYSNAAEVALKGGTMVRALGLEFPDEKLPVLVADENMTFMFGKSLLVVPVMESEASEVLAVLPASEQWYDFWTGKPVVMKSGYVPVSIDRLPLYVRAGSIIPMASGKRYAADRADSPLNICIYPGANGTFTLYEDDGVTYGYERGEYSTIPFDWDDKTGTLTIGDRSGSYKDMPHERTFVVRTPDGHETHVGYSGVQKSIKVIN